MCIILGGVRFSSHLPRTTGIWHFCDQFNDSD